jgi:hypothetical protein
MKSYAFRKIARWVGLDLGTGGRRAAWMEAGVTEPPNYDGPHVPIIVIMTSDSHTYIPHNLKGLLSSEQDPITGVLQYYNSLFKIFNRVK